MTRSRLSSAALLVLLSSLVALALPSAAAALCTPDEETLCLGDRFAVQASFTTPQGQAGQGKAVALTEDTGFFWFFQSDNVEIVIKVLNGCPLNSRYWVFAAGLTNVAVEITVTDTEADDQNKVYSNPQGTGFAPIQDTSAFDTCSAIGG